MQNNYDIRFAVCLLVFVFISIASANGQQQPPQVPSVGLDQFRSDLAEIESADKKLDYYTNIGSRFAHRMPDSIFVLANEVKNLPGLNRNKQEAFYLYMMANAWRSINKDSVIHYAEKAAKQLRFLGEHKAYLTMASLLGSELSWQHEYLRADSVFKNAIAYSQTLEEVEYPVKYLYGNLGSLYSMVGAYDLAIDMYERFLVSESNPANVCNINSKLAVNLMKINEHQRGIELLTPCLEYEHLPPPFKSMIRSNLSRMYERIGEKKLSLSLMEEAAAISSFYQVPNLEITNLITLGTAYLQYDKIAKADSVRVLLEKITANRRISPHFTINKNTYLASVFLARQKYSQAITSVDKAIQTAKRHNLEFMLRDAYQTKAKAHEYFGQMDKVIQSLRDKQRLDEMRHSKETEKNLAMMSVRYQLQNKEAQLVTATNKLKTVKLRNAVIILFLVLIALYALYKYRIHYLFKEQQTRNKIARDLHDDLSGTLSSISFFSEAAKRVQVATAESGRYLQMIDKSAIEAKEKINDIIWAIDPEKDDWSLFLNKCKRFAADAFDSKGIDYTITIDDNFSRAINLELRQNLWLIYKEIINNLVQHSEANKAKVIFIQKDKTLHLEIEDDGIGFEIEKETDRHGVNNIKHRAKEIGAAVELKSKPGEGTIWKIELL